MYDNQDTSCAACEARRLPSLFDRLSRKAACVLLALLLATAGALNPYCETRKAEAVLPAVAALPYAGYALCALLAIYGLDTSGVNAQQVADWLSEFYEDYDSAMNYAANAAAEFIKGCAADGVDIAQSTLDVTAQDLDKFADWCVECGQSGSIPLDDIASINAADQRLNSMHFVFAGFMTWLAGQGISSPKNAFTATQVGTGLDYSALQYTTKGVLGTSAGIALGLPTYQINLEASGRWTYTDFDDYGNDAMWWDYDFADNTTIRLDTDGSGGWNVTGSAVVGTAAGYLAVQRISNYALDNDPQLKKCFQPLYLSSNLYDMSGYTSDIKKDICVPLGIDNRNGKLLCVALNMTQWSLRGVTVSNPLEALSKIALTPYAMTCTASGSKILYEQIKFWPWLVGANMKVVANSYGDLYWIQTKYDSIREFSLSQYQAFVSSGSVDWSLGATPSLVSSRTTLLPENFCGLMQQPSILAAQFLTRPLTGSLSNSTFTFSPYVRFQQTTYETSKGVTNAPLHLGLRNEQYSENDWGYSVDNVGKISKASTFPTIAAAAFGSILSSKLDRYPDALDRTDKTGAASAAAGTAVIGAGVAVDDAGNINRRGNVYVPPYAGPSSNPVSGSHSWGDALADTGTAVVPGVRTGDVASDKTAVVPDATTTSGVTTGQGVQDVTVAEAVEAVPDAPVVPPNPPAPVIPPVIDPDDPGTFDVMAKFPFCLPNDFSKLVSLYSAEPEAPRFTWVFWSPKGNIEYEVSLEQFDSVASVLRTGMLISLMCGLVFVAVRFINMLRSAAK